jgi:hypothetical protein
MGSRLQTTNELCGKARPEHVNISSSVDTGGHKY